MIETIFFSVVYIYKLLLQIGNMEKETTSIKVNPELWKEAKHLAIDRGMTISDLLESLIKRELKK